MKSVKKKDIDEWNRKGGIHSPSLFCKTQEEMERYKRNCTLIDLQHIPETIKTNIIQEYKTLKTSNKDVLNYLIKHRLTKILESVNL